MSKSVTVEDAVARMVNVDYIPTGYTLLNMMEGFLEEANDKLLSAKRDQQSADEIAALEICLEACRARNSLAKLLMASIQREMGSLNESLIKLADDFDNQKCVTSESIAHWASINFGIAIPEWFLTEETGAPSSNVRWEDVTIKIYNNYRIAYFSSATGPKGIEKTFQDIDLKGRRKNEPNDVGIILIGLSNGAKFPQDKNLLGRHATPISKLRASLKLLTGISSDPFCTFNKADGYKPRFQLIDDRKNADERAKKRARSVSFDDMRNHGAVNVDSHDDEVQIEQYEFHDPDQGETMADADADATATAFLAKHRK